MARCRSSISYVGDGKTHMKMKRGNTEEGSLVKRANGRLQACTSPSGDAWE